MSEKEIKWYVSTKEPMDKAGAYAIQGQGAYFIEKVEGSYATVMGLPIEKLIPRLKSLGLLRAWVLLPD
jgi:septum formation protein